MSPFDLFIHLALDTPRAQLHLHGRFFLFTSLSISSTATLMLSPWSVSDSLNLPTPMEDSLIRLLAKRTAMGKVASEFFWHSARIARLGP